MLGNIATDGYAIKTAPAGTQAPAFGTYSVWRDGRRSLENVLSQHFVCAIDAASHSV